MASTYSTNLRLELIGTGEQSGTWGTTTNTNLGSLIEQAIAGYATVTITDADYTLTANNGATDQARSMALNVVSSVTLTATRNVICPSVSKLYVVRNATTGSQSIVIKTSAGSGITVANGATAIVLCTGADVIDPFNTKQNALGYTPVNKAGDTMTGALILNANPSAALGAATKQYVDGASVTYATNSGGISSTGGIFGYSYSGQNTAYASQSGPQVQNQGGGGATISFHRVGAYGLNLGLDSDNVFRIGGWSASSNRLQMDMFGNLTMAGNVTAYSDRKLKTDLEQITDALSKVEQLTGYTYTRTDSGERHTGLVAQDVEKVLPEAVTNDGEHLSLAYGNMVGLLVEAVKELSARVKELEAA